MKNLDDKNLSNPYVPNSAAYRSGGKQEIDIFLTKRKIAVEYDGEFHFLPFKHVGGEKRLKHVQKLDELKDQKIKEHPEDVSYFIRFNFKQLPLTKAKVLNELRSVGVSC